MKKLEGKVALITGGNSGIGLAAAKRLVNEGAYVFITGRREAELAEAVQQIGTNVSGVRGDAPNARDLAKISPDDLLITLYETPGENISFGRGLAQRAHISDKKKVAS
jgi:NAD(P)-dependent dehydrogenase (short-subunit alcohol dehydrogenase family)